MKPLFLGCFVFLALSRVAPASLEGPITSYFPYADTIYLVKVVGMEQGVATFSVTEILRGKAVPSLSLTAEFPELFKPGSKWALLSCEAWRKTGFREDVVGSFFMGDCGWIFAKIIPSKDEKDPYAFTVDDLKVALKQNPEKPWSK